MSVLVLSHGIRRAAKHHWCELCGAAIHNGDYYTFQNNVAYYDGSVYTWHECLPCRQAAPWVAAYSQDAGWSDEGYTIEDAAEWAPDAALHASSATERWAARDWLARAAGGG